MKSIKTKYAPKKRAKRRPTLPAGSSCYDFARDLAGTVKGLPKDLAHNPKYVEGFGR